MSEITRAPGRPVASSSSSSSTAGPSSKKAAAPAALAPATHAHGPADSLEHRREGSAPTVAPKSAATAPAAAGVAVKRGLAAPTKPYNPNPDAAKLYTAMKGGMTGFGTDEQAIADVLRNKSPEQVKALRAAYADRYPGRSLDGDIKDELSGSDLKNAMSVLTAKKASAPAVDVKDPKALLTTLSAASPKERAAIVAAHQTTNGRSLAADIGKGLKGDDAIRATALLANNDGLDKAAQLHTAMKGFGTDEAAIDTVLSSSTPAARKSIETAYQQQYGTSLRSALSSELSGTDRALATAHLDNDAGAATAARLQSALGGIGTDKRAIERAFDGTSAADRARAATVFAAHTGHSLDATLSKKLDGQDLDDARTLASTGALSDVQRLDRSMRGAGTTEGELKAVLEGKSKGEIDALSTSFQARTGRSLHAAVADELGGRDRFDVEQMLRGTVDLSTDAGLKEAVARATQTHEYERSGAGNVVGNAMTAIGGNGHVLDHSTARLQSALASATQPDGTLSSSGADRLRTLLGYQRSDVDAYRTARDSAADAAGTGAAVVAGIAVTVATAGAAAPLVIAAGAAASAATKGLVGVAVRGQTTEDATWSDVRKGAVDGLAVGVAGAATRGVATVVTRTMTAGESIAARAGMRVAQQVEGEVVRRGLVSGTVEKALTGVGKGAVAGGTTGAGVSVVDPNTWQGDLEAGIAAVATQTARGALAGGLTGLNPTGLIAGDLVGRLTPQLQRATNATFARAGIDVRAQVERLAADSRVLQQTTAKLVVEAPKSALTGAATSSLAALFSGNPQDMLSAAVDGAASRTQGAASGAATDAVKETLQRSMQRPAK